MRRPVISFLLAFSITTLVVENQTAAVEAQAAEVETDTNIIEDENLSVYSLADNIQDGVILHCFDWTYNDIKEELPNIAKAGFTSVQTSPAQKSAKSGAWYWMYQPLNFSVTKNKLGTKEELKSLCEEADKYGIKVIVDVIANHMASSHTNIQGDLKDDKYWHLSGYTSDGSNGTMIIDWDDRWQVTHGDIGTPDINSENSYVQATVKSYVQELKKLGVDGIRWDAAKHISLPSEDCDFWKKVTGEGLYNYGEILVGPDDRKEGNEDLMQEYTVYMSVTDSDYGKTLRDAFNAGVAPATSGNWSERGVAKDKLVYWAETHDTWSNDDKWGYSNEMSQNVIDRAYAVAASRNDITALYFSRPDSKEKESIKAGQKGSTHFTSPEVAAVNHFHNTMIGQEDCYLKSAGCAVVCREQGAVVVKGKGCGEVKVENGNATTQPGIYIDEITGNEWTVTKTTISGTVGSTGIAVLYKADLLMPSAFVTPGNSSYRTDTFTLTLNCKNTGYAQYSVDGGEYQLFTDGQTITIGENAEYGTKTTVCVKAENDFGISKEETYVYTKKDPQQIQKVYFDNTGYQWTDVYCYIYDESQKPVLENAEWPGVKMVKDSATGYYMAEVPENLEYGNIIFAENENTSINRYPLSNQKGLELQGRIKLLKSGYVFETYDGVTPLFTPIPTVSPIITVTETPTVTPIVTSVPTATETPVPTRTEQTTQKIYFDNASYQWSKVYCYIYDESEKLIIENAKWPGVEMIKDSATGYYMAEVPENLQNGYVIFTENYSIAIRRYPEKDKQGLSLEGKTKILKGEYVFETYYNFVDNPTVTVEPTVSPTAVATQVPTVTPTVEPTRIPTEPPTVEPTQIPTVTPTVEPTRIPTATPTVEPTQVPTVTPTVKLTEAPTTAPTVEPTRVPTATPTVESTKLPTPTVIPTQKPTEGPTAIETPTATSTVTPIQIPTAKPELKISKVSCSKTSPQTVGTQVKVTAKAVGGNGTYQYCFSIKNSNGKTVAKTKWNKSSHYNWKPDKAGKYKIVVMVREKNKKNTTIIASRTLTFEVAQKLTIDKITIKKKAKGWYITAKTKGGSGTKHYYFYAKNSKGKRIQLSKKYSSKGSFYWKNVKKGTYKIYVKVKDNSGSSMKCSKIS